MFSSSHILKHVWEFNILKNSPNMTWNWWVDWRLAYIALKKTAFISVCVQKMTLLVTVGWSGTRLVITLSPLFCDIIYVLSHVPSYATVHALSYFNCYYVASLLSPLQGLEKIFLTTYLCSRKYKKFGINLVCFTTSLS